MNILPFNFFTNSRLYFGVGKFKILFELINNKDNILIFIGKNSFLNSDNGRNLFQYLEENTKEYYIEKISQEPTVDIINGLVEKYLNKKINLIISIGGGSVIDAGKAISAMLVEKGDITDFLEGIGAKKLSGEKIPFIAIPTTAGTGSEATKNAVISSIGDNGFKKSIRHDNFIPDIVIVDPELTLSCPRNVTIYSGLDAFTQLLESYLSPNANILTELLCISGIEAIIDSIEKVYNDGDDLEARCKMSYGAYLSGVTLSNAGLGVIHGFASIIGGYINLPHGLICSLLLGVCTEKNIKLAKENKNLLAIKKFAKIGALFAKDKKNNFSEEEYCDILIENIFKLNNIFKIGKFSDYYAINDDLAEKIILNTENKNNCVLLNYEDKKEVFLSVR